MAVLDGARWAAIMFSLIGSNVAGQAAR